MSRWISASLLALIGSSAGAAPLPTTEKYQLVGTDSADSIRRQAVTVLLREADGQHLGSGVLVAVAPGGRWVVTNRHVVGTQSTVCVVMADRSATAALVMPPKTTKKQNELDLALIWLPSRSQDEPLVATTSEKAAQTDSIPLVVATGFPVPLTNSMDGLIFSERAGLLIPLLTTPLEGGLDLTYTAAIDKGMSGGGVFVGSELIGINSAHRDPLWPGQWRDENGRVVDSQENQKLALVSIGISSKRIRNLAEGAQAPDTAQMNQLSMLDCEESWSRSRQ